MASSKYLHRVTNHQEQGEVWFNVFHPSISPLMFYPSPDFSSWEFHVTCFGHLYLPLTTPSRSIPILPSTQFCELFCCCFRQSNTTQIFLDVWLSIGAWSTQQGLYSYRHSPPPPALPHTHTHFLEEIVADSCLVKSGCPACPASLSMLGFGRTSACTGIAHSITSSVSLCVQLPCFVQKLFTCSHPQLLVLTPHTTPLPASTVVWCRCSV